MKAGQKDMDGMELLKFFLCFSINIVMKNFLSLLFDIVIFLCVIPFKGEKGLTIAI